MTVLSPITSGLAYKKGFTFAVLQEFIVFKEPGQKPVQAFIGQWQAKEFSLNTNTFWLKPFHRHNSLLALHNMRSAALDELLFAVKAKTAGERVNDHNPFIDYVNHILAQIDKDEVQKVVPARSKFFAATINGLDLFKKNIAKYPDAFCYALQSKDYGTWIGASPETFFDFNNGVGGTMALAGTLPLQSEEFSSKEFTEQNIVAQYIQRILKKYTSDVVIQKPTSIKAAHLSHLRSEIACKVESTLLPKLLNDLHPTPAVGGFPLLPAIKTILENEPQGRQLYAGWLGMAHNQKLNTYVNLRCAKLYSNGMLCYAGCGVNKGSVPEQEYLETENKMQVMASLLA
jgi:isochorismate synthase